jgi:hypothetical protein
MNMKYFKEQATLSASVILMYVYDYIVMIVQTFKSVRQSVLYVDYIHFCNQDISTQKGNRH